MRNEAPNIYTLKKPKKISDNNTFMTNSDKIVGTEKRTNEETTRNNRLNSNNQSPLVYKFKKKNNRFKGSYSRPYLHSLYKDSIKKNNLHCLKKKHYKNNEINELDVYDYDLNNISNRQSDQGEGKIKRKIKITRAWIYLCFLCVRRRKIAQNVLLDEGMNIISNKLDIFNIFYSLNRSEKLNNKLWKNEYIEMSDKSKARL